MTWSALSLGAVASVCRAADYRYMGDCFNITKDIMLVTHLQCLLQLDSVCPGVIQAPVACSCPAVHIPFLIYSLLFPAKPGSFSLCLPAELWSCFLAVPPLGVHCVTSLHCFLLQMSSSILFSSVIFFLRSTVGYRTPFLPASKLSIEMHWELEVPGRMVM